MKTIIAGSRTITDYETVVDAISTSGFPISEVVCGGASGVDSLGELYAFHNAVPCKKFPAKWHLYGKKAGHIRNQEMADYAEALIAVWDGVSTGTADMIARAQEKGLQVYVHVLNIRKEATWPML